MKVLVTGGLGFIGSHIVDDLVKAGHDVRVLDNLEYQVHQGKFPSYANEKSEYIIGSVLDPDIVDRALADVDVVFHEAASVGIGQSMYKIHYFTLNTVSGTAQLLDRMVNGNFPVKKLVIAASNSSYGEGLYSCESCGDVSPPIRSKNQMAEKKWELHCPICNEVVEPIPTPETKSLDSTAVYTLNKKYQEELCMNVCKTYGIPVVSLRYFNVYGPRQSLSNPYTGVAAIFTSRIKNGQPPSIYEDGLQSRDFVHVEDVAGINAFVMDSPNANGEIFNVGTSHPFTIKKLAEDLISGLGRGDLEPRITNQGRPGDVRHCFADNTKIKKLGYRFKYPSLDVETLIQWSENVEAVDNFESAEKELKEKLKL
ncbi:MAG: NAD-dependent epimerase/dehydratase family protein [Promethearchaeota archaeon]